MKKFIIFVIADSTELAGKDEMKNIDEFNENLQKNNQWIYAAGICDHEKATLIDNRNDADKVRPGSLFNTKEHYSGFWIIQCDDQQSALKLASAGSKACNRKVELRPFLR
ncbi:MAG: YciI family protein [Actinomycetes bacterium]